MAGLGAMIVFTASPMVMRFPQRSKIVFKGMDKPAKPSKSINNISHLGGGVQRARAWCFKELRRLRHPTLPLHIILTTNPAARSNWTYQHFLKAVIAIKSSMRGVSCVRETRTITTPLPTTTCFCRWITRAAARCSVRCLIASPRQFGVNGSLSCRSLRSAA